MTNLVFPPSDRVRSSSRGTMLSIKSTIFNTFSPLGNWAGHTNISEEWVRTPSNY